MEIEGWNERYRSEGTAESAPTKVLVDIVAGLQRGSALDLACGSGRNTLWLAAQGWEVKSVDGSAVAIDLLREQAQRQGLRVETEVADLLDQGFQLPEAKWDLVAICYYLQRDLIERAKQAVKPGGTILVIVHTTEGDEEPTQSRLLPGELRRYFETWEIVHDYEGAPNDPAHKRRVAEVVARRPLSYADLAN